MAKPSPLSLVAETGEERPAVNVQTEEALQKLLDALEARQRRSFDPRMLAMASAFLTPSPTGSAFEGMGRAARAYASADEAMRQEDIETTKERLGLLGQMAQIQRAGARDKAFNELIESIPPLAPGGVKPPAAEVPEDTMPGSAAYSPFVGMPIEGIPIMQGNPALLANRRLALDARTRLRLAQQDPNANIADIVDKINEAERKAMEDQKKRYEMRENGVVDFALGLYFPFPKGTEPVDRQIFGKVYKVPPGIAARLDAHQLRGDDEGYRSLLKSLDIPVPDKTTQPTTFKSEAEREVEKITRETVARKEAELSVETEAALGSNAKSAREMFNAAQRLQKATRESPLIFGVLQAPGLGTSILTLIDEGIRAGNTSISLGGLQQAIIRALPDVTPKDIVNLERAYSALAELELKYTQLYLKGQGQVTEGERLIVRKLAGTEKNSAEFLNTQAKLIEMRSQFDIDVIDAFRRAKTANPEITWLRFERSEAYRRMQDQYDRKLGKELGVTAAVPSSKRKDSPFSLDAFEDALQKRGSR